MNLKKDQNEKIKSSARIDGFTLIELLIVISIIGILAAIAVPNYQWSVIKAREAVLKEDLYNFRSTIDQFHADQGKYPDDINDLVSKGYMREIPRDPFTKEKDWVVVAPPADDPTATASATTAKEGVGSVYDVHSNSATVGSDGRSYNEW